MDVKSMKTVPIELKKIDTKNLRVFHEMKNGKLEEMEFKTDGKKLHLAVKVSRITIL